MTLCLLGEADWFLARLLTRYDEERGLEMARAEVGEELLAMTRRLVPEIVIADPDLPGAQRGQQAISALRTDPRFTNLSVIASTWLTEQEARMSFGPATVFLPKSPTCPSRTSSPRLTRRVSRSSDMRQE